jgi:histidinol-phosphate aminotransferase
VPLETIEAAYAAHPGILFVDEAYAEFMPAGTPSALTLLEGRERLVVSRTMSKAFAFAGARVGYLVAALAHAPEMLGMVGEIVAQRDRLLAELPVLGFRAFDSHANFVLFDGVHDPAATFRALLERDILIRDVGLPGALRVTAGTEAETTAFLAALAALGPGGAR